MPICAIYIYQPVGKQLNATYFFGLFGIFFYLLLKIIQPCAFPYDLFDLKWNIKSTCFLQFNYRAALQLACDAPRNSRVCQAALQKEYKPDAFLMNKENDWPACMTTLWVREHLSVLDSHPFYLTDHVYATLFVDEVLYDQSHLIPCISIVRTLR